MINLPPKTYQAGKGTTISEELDNKVDIDLIETQLPDNLVYSDDLEEVEEPLIQVYNSQLLNNKQESELNVNSAIKDGNNNVITDTYYKKTDTVDNSTNSENADKLLQDGNYVGAQFLNVAYATNAGKLGNFEPSHYATKVDLLTDMQLAINTVLVGVDNQQYLIIEDGVLSGSSIDIEFLVIPNNVTSIDNQAFYNKQLTSVVIPDSVTSIGNVAFGYNQLTSVVIGNSVISIGSSAFSDNQLISVVIPDSVTSIGNSAFSSNQLTSVVIPNSVTSIGLAVFANNELTSVVIPYSVTSIGNQAFERNKLTSVVIPFSVNSIGNLAFAWNQLTEIIFERNTPPTIQSNTFGNNPDLLTQGSIYVPNNSVNAYKTADNYTQFASIIKPISEKGGN